VPLLDVATRSRVHADGHAQSRSSFAIDPMVHNFHDAGGREVHSGFAAAIIIATHQERDFMPKRPSADLDCRSNGARSSSATNPWRRASNNDAPSSYQHFGSDPSG
jgi:hypothetical protein